MIKILIIAFGIINLILAFYSIHKIRQDKEHVIFTWWWSFINGSFCWEDMLIFGLLHFGIALLATVLNNPTTWLICYLVFWIVRSAGETLYYFLEQFIVPQHHPHYFHDFLAPLRKIIGEISDQKCFIICQVFMQSILVVSSIALIFLLKQ
jgi:hypothetical protein